MPSSPDSVSLPSPPNRQSSPRRPPSVSSPARPSSVSPAGVPPMRSLPVGPNSGGTVAPRAGAHGGPTRAGMLVGATGLPPVASTTTGADELDEPVGAAGGGAGVGVTGPSIVSQSAAPRSTASTVALSTPAPQTMRSELSPRALIVSSPAPPSIVSTPL